MSTDNNKSTWLDKDTSLMWQVDINGEEYTLADALEYVEKLNNTMYGGYDDWKIPTIDELQTILTDNANKNSYNNNYYIKKSLSDSMEVSSGSVYFWSSSQATNYDFYMYGAWGINFRDRRKLDADTDRIRPVRCVRVNR